MKKPFVILPGTRSNYLKQLPSIVNGKNDVSYTKRNAYKEFRNSIAQSTCVQYSQA